MSRSRLAALVLTLVLLVLPAAAVAQDAATPAAQSQGAINSERSSAGSSVGLGTPVSYLDEDGDEIGVITALNIIDPFDDFSEFFTPDEGVRYVGLEVDVRSTGDDIEVSPFDFSLWTSDGFLTRSAFVSRPEGREDPAELESIELEEGETATGIVFFAVPENATIRAVVWQPEFDRLLLLADLS